MRFKVKVKAVEDEDVVQKVRKLTYLRIEFGPRDKGLGRDFPENTVS